MGWIADYYNVEFEKLGVELKLDMEATADKIAEMNPDAVLVATGSKSVIRIYSRNNWRKCIYNRRYSFRKSRTEE